MAEIGEFTEGALVFIWNADSGLHNSLMDSLHKALSPQTYSCKLCQLTFGITGPKARWTKFLGTLGRLVECYHRDEFRQTPVSRQFPGLELPAVLTCASEKWQILMSRDEILKIADLDGLLSELKKRIQAV